MKYLIALVLLVAAATAQTLPKVCTDKSSRWVLTDKAVKNPALNGTYHFSMDNKELSDAFAAEADYVVAIDGTTASQINYLCDAVERQQAEIIDLQNTVLKLIKVVAQDRAASTRDAKAAVSRPKTVDRNHLLDSSGSRGSRQPSQLSSQALATSTPE